MVVFGEYFIGVDWMGVREVVGVFGLEVFGRGYRGFLKVKYG